MKNIFYALMAATALISCNDDRLNFSAFTITDKTGTVNIAVAADGTITSWGKKGGTLSHDGTITDATGRQTVTLDATGTLSGTDGNTLLTVGDDGTIQLNGSPEMHWSDRGELIKGGEKLGYVIKPADDGSYKAASIVFYLYSGLFTR